MPHNLPKPPAADELKAYGPSPGPPTRCSRDLRPEDGKVCVTGSSGFIALHLVEQLLARGYTVVATMRSSPAKAAPLRKLAEQHPDKLTIATGCDLLQDGSFDEAVEGCVGIFHTASPFFPAVDKGEGVSASGVVDLVLPAVQGTRNVLESCARAPSVKRVVLTSSFAAILNPGSPAFATDCTYNDSVWNVSSFPDETGTWTQAGAGAHIYRYSKIMAEKTAWDFVRQDHITFDLATINPPLVVGANHHVVSQPSELNESSWLVYKWLTGKPVMAPNSMGFVEVGDVATAHIVAYEAAAACGKRFLTCAPAELWSTVCATLREVAPNNPNVATEAPDDPKQRWTLDTSRLQALGMSFVPAVECVRRQALSLIQQFPDAATGGGGPEALKASGRQ
jgi:nucleoside-diphosphate-sugar epimerase